MTTRPFGRPAGVAVLALSLWRCGGGDATPAQSPALGGRSGATPIDACALVPKREVESIVGGSIASATGDTSEHTYTKPVSYTASCMYVGDRAVMLGVTYPAAAGGTTSEQLAARITKHLRSQVGSNPSTDELFRHVQVRPVSGLAGPAAEYVMLDQASLELYAGDYLLKIMAPSLASARAVAERATSRLE